MSLVVDALRSSLVRELVSLRGRALTSNLADIITCAPKAGFDLNFDDASNSIVIDFREPKFISLAIGGDASRFASAAFVTIALLENMGQPNNFPWTMIKLYYSAFYAGHSILRLVGQSCSYLDAPHVNQLRKLAATLDIDSIINMESGLYHCVLNPAQTGLSLFRARGRVGGAHESFWKIFAKFLDTNGEQILRGQLTPDDARAVFLKFASLKGILESHGASSGSWLSQIRNDVQYRHAMSVWPPSSIKQATRDGVIRLVAQWTHDPMDIDLDHPPGGEFGEFVSACVFVVSLCRAILESLFKQSSVGEKSFAKGPLSYCA